MGLSMFIQTCGKIARNPGVPTLTGLARHSVWHLARRVCPLPMRVALTAQSALQLQRRSELNGCVALAWSQRLYDYNNMSFIRELTRQGVAQVCMDVGSNIGPYALIMSEQRQTRVLCFEPHPETFTVLNRVLPGWKAILGEPGPEMQAAFAYLRDAIDAACLPEGAAAHGAPRGTPPGPFVLTVRAACLRARKPAVSSPLRFEDDPNNAPTNPGV